MHQDRNLRLLAVLAHPDDESFGLGGTLALYALHGVEVYLVCATRGEVGDVPEELINDDENVADVRETELRCATDHLGLKDVYFLGYRDSGMPGSMHNRHPRALAAAPVEEIASKITHLIRRIRPQVVITFDPFGGYGHPDHIAIQRATLEAYRAAGIPERFPDELPPYQPQKLYYHTFPRRLMRFIVRLLPLIGQDPHRFGRNADIDLSAIASQDFPVHAQIDIRSVFEKKQKASACHSSQSSLSNVGIMNWIGRLFGRYETYMRADPPALKTQRETDLFEGVEYDPDD